MKSIDVLFTPADFAALSRRNLDETLCVVFDVFRATSSMVTALAGGAAGILPVAEIPEALEIRRKQPGALLAGERDGVRIRGELTGGTDFDLGNSPREFIPETVSGRTVVMSTTNGTRALRACAHADRVLIGSFLNLEATAAAAGQGRWPELLILCSGTFDEAAYEDTLAAGALCDSLWAQFAGAEISDAALMARQLYLVAGDRVAEEAARSRNGRRLLSRPELRDDVAFCLRRDVFDFAAALGADGQVRKAGN